jgi:hypothetical protein
MCPAAAPRIEAAERTANSLRVDDIVGVIFWAAFDSTSMIFAGRGGCNDREILFGNLSIPERLEDKLREGESIAGRHNGNAGP